MTNYTTAEFESALLQIDNVDIINFNYVDGFVYEAKASINSINLTWDACGRAFHYSNRCKQYDITHLLPVRISDDECTIDDATRTHRFLVPLFKFNCRCSSCSLMELCMQNIEKDFPFPCREFNRKDNKNGIFKLQKYE